MRIPISDLGRAALPLTLFLTGCGDEPPFEPKSGPPAALEIVSGNEQEGKTGEWLDAFVVRVVDAEGVGVAGARVNWSLVSGVGRVHPIESEYVEVTGDPLTATSTLADSDGLAEAFFFPTELGPVTVSASVGEAGREVDGSPATFSAEVTVLLIEADYKGECFWTPCFAEFDGTSHTVVPVGTTLEWVNRSRDPVTVTSTSVPPAAEAFDSGRLEWQQRFQFVPAVAGTWEYVDKIGGEPGIFTAVAEGDG